MWFCSKDEETNFHADIAYIDAFKAFSYKVKLLEKIVADRNNSILKNIIIAVSLKYPSNIWRSLEMPLISFKIELKLKWTKQCVLAPDGVGNGDASSKNIIFFNQRNKVICSVPVVNLIAKDNQNYQNFLAKDSEDQCIQMNMKQKVRIEI